MSDEELKKLQNEAEARWEAITKTNTKLPAHLVTNYIVTDKESAKNVMRTYEQFSTIIGYINSLPDHYIEEAQNAQDLQINVLSSEFPFPGNERTVRNKGLFIPKEESDSGKNEIYIRPDAKYEYIFEEFTHYYDHKKQISNNPEFREALKPDNVNIIKAYSLFFFHKDYNGKPGTPYGFDTNTADGLKDFGAEIAADIVRLLNERSVEYQVQNLNSLRFEIGRISKVSDPNTLTSDVDKLMYNAYNKLTSKERNTLKAALNAIPGREGYRAAIESIYGKELVEEIAEKFQMPSLPEIPVFKEALNNPVYRENIEVLSQALKHDNKAQFKPTDIMALPSQIGIA